MVTFRATLHRASATVNRTCARKTVTVANLVITVCPTLTRPVVTRATVTPSVPPLLQYAMKPQGSVRVVTTSREGRVIGVKAVDLDQLAPRVAATLLEQKAVRLCLYCYLFLLNYHTLTFF